MTLADMDYTIKHYENLRLAIVSKMMHVGYETPEAKQLDMDELDRIDSLLFSVKKRLHIEVQDIALTCSRIYPRPLTFSKPIS